MNDTLAVLICLLALVVSFTVMVRAGRKSCRLCNLAQSATESAHPNLWDGLAGAWIPYDDDMDYVYLHPEIEFEAPPDDLIYYPRCLISEEIKQIYEEGK